MNFNIDCERGCDMELFGCRILDSRVMRTAACVAAFFRGRNLSVSDCPARTGVRAEWMEQDGPHVTIVGKLDAFSVEIHPESLRNNRNDMEYDTMRRGYPSGCGKDACPMEQGLWLVPYFFAFSAGETYGRYFTGTEKY